MVAVEAATKREPGHVLNKSEHLTNATAAETGLVWFQRPGPSLGESRASNTDVAM